MSFWQHVVATIVFVDAYAIFLFLLLAVVRDVQRVAAEAVAEATFINNTDAPPADNQPRHAVCPATILAGRLERLPL